MPRPRNRIATAIGSTFACISLVLVGLLVVSLLLYAITSVWRAIAGV